jgi:predicted SAM-dependent methyltransferase
MEVFARVLRAVPESRLLLNAGGLASEQARHDVQARFERLGIHPERLILRADKAAEALACHREIDVALDTFPYCGVLEMLQAMWMGVPGVSLTGQTHLSRASTSALRHAGYGQWAVSDKDAYVARAVALARDEAGRRQLRAELRGRLSASPVMDARKFAHGLEQAYRAMWSSYMDIGREPLRLHVGGQQKMPGWKILNAQPGLHVDYVGDCSDLSQFADQSVDQIYASHVLEHLSHVDALPRALAEFKRVLKKGGKAMISVPDFEVLCRLFLDPKHGPSERLHIMRMVFGGQIDEHDFHRVGLTFEILNGYLIQAGFERVERSGDFGLFDDTSSLRFSGVPISLNVIAAT